jgi:AcrR family transcriptional regulator
MAQAPPKTSPAGTKPLPRATKLAPAQSLEPADARELRRMQRLEIGRVQVLDAAEVLFAEFGYTATSLEAIATKSGFSVGGVYVFFESKDALYAAVSQRRGVLILERMQACLHTKLPGLAKLLNMVDAAVTTLQEHPAYGRLVLQGASVTLTTALDNRADGGQFADGVERYAAAIKQGQREGEIRKGDPRKLGIVVAGLVVVHAQIDTVIAGDPGGMTKDELLEIVRNALRP